MNEPTGFDRANDNYTSVNEAVDVKDDKSEIEIMIDLANTRAEGILDEIRRLNIKLKPIVVERQNDTEAQGEIVPARTILGEHLSEHVGRLRDIQEKLSDLCKHIAL
jgi:hypothetical protein